MGRVDVPETASQLEPSFCRQDTGLWCKSILFSRTVLLPHKANPGLVLGSTNCCGSKAASTQWLGVARGLDQLTDSVNRATVDCFPFFPARWPSRWGDCGNSRAALLAKSYGTAT